jgi:hypothetical protein
MTNWNLTPEARAFFERVGIDRGFEMIQEARRRGISLMSSSPLKDEDFFHKRLTFQPGDQTDA